MTGAAAPAELAVRRLRVVDRGGDALRARLAAERLLSVARPRPRGLAPGAVLVVRSLALRAPGGCAAELARWRAAAEEVLEARLRAAARPAWETVPADAPAVLFTDRAELLACLADDLAAGLLGERWWWRAELGAAVGAADVAVRWEADATDVPAALELLAARGRAVDAVRALPAGVAERILVAIAAAHAVALPAGWPAAAPAADPPTTQPPRAPHRAAGSRSAAPAPPASAPAPVAPWDADVPEARTQALAPAQRALLGVALALRRRRALTRAAAFAQALARWWADPSAAPAASAEHAGVPQAAAPAAAPRATSPSPLAASTPGAAADPQPNGQRQPAAPAAPSSEAGDPPAAARRSAAGARSTRSASGPAAPPAPRRVAARRAPVPPPLRPCPDAASVPAVPTALGGLFLLVNLGLYLDLYGDFTRPRTPGIALDPWDFAALLGRELLPAARRGRLARDPAWRLLAELAGRDAVHAPHAGGTVLAGSPPPAPHAPGAGFHPPRAWRVPPAWLAPFDGARGAWRWSAADGRLRLLHPASFLALDVPVRGEPTAQLARELHRLGIASGGPQVRPAPTGSKSRSSRSAHPAAGIRRPALAGDDAAARRAAGSLWSPPEHDDDALRRAARPAAGVARPALARWVGWLAPYAAARLRAALGARTPAAAARTTCILPARVAISPGRVDLTIPLAVLPLALRRAGLDRTPGWIPAAGRHVAVHFDA